MTDKGFPRTDIVSETTLIILIKQGRTDDAKVMAERLSEKFPQHNDYYRNYLNEVKL